MSTPPFDTAKPNVARMYDYWLGGTDNFEADREAAEAVRRIRPNVAEQALELVPPGIVETSAWLPGQPETVPEEHASMIVAGVGRCL